MTEDTSGLFDMFGGGESTKETKALKGKVDGLSKSVTNLKTSVESIKKQQSALNQKIESIKVPNITGLTKAVNTNSKNITNLNQKVDNIKIPEAHMPKIVSMSGNTKISEPKTVRITFPKMASTPVVIALVEEEVDIPVKLPRLGVKKIAPVERVRLKRIRSPKSSMSNAKKTAEERAAEESARKAHQEETKQKAAEEAARKAALEEAKQKRRERYHAKKAQEYKKSGNEQKAAEAKKRAAEARKRALAASRKKAQSEEASRHHYEQSTLYRRLEAHHRDNARFATRSNIGADISSVSLTLNKAKYGNLVRNIGKKIPIIHMPTVGKAKILGQLRLTDYWKNGKRVKGIKTLLTESEKKGMPMFKVNVPSIPKINSMPAINGLSLPRVWYAVFEPRKHKISNCGRNDTEHEINKGCPYNGWIIPVFESPSVAKKSWSERQKNVKNTINKWFPVTHSDWGTWQVFDSVKGARAYIGGAYNERAYENFLHRMGGWNVGGIDFNCNLKPWIANLMHGTMTPSLKGILSIDNKVVSTVRSSVKGVTNTVVGKKTWRDHEKVSFVMYRPKKLIGSNDTYLSKLQDAIKAYKNQPNPKNGSNVSLRLRLLLQNPPTKTTVKTHYTGGINAVLDYVKISLNDAIDTINAVSEAVPISLLSMTKASADKIIKPAYAYMKQLANGASNMVKTLIDQYNGYVKDFNNNSDDARSKLIERLNQTAASLESLIGQYNTAITKFQANINSAIAGINAALSTLEKNIENVVNSENGSISDVEHNINTNTIAPINETINALNGVISKLDGTAIQTVTTKVSKMIKPLEVTKTSFSISVPKGTLHYTIIGLQ